MHICEFSSFDNFLMSNYSIGHFLKLKCKLCKSQKDSSQIFVKLKSRNSQLFFVVMQCFNRSNYQKSIPRGFQGNQYCLPSGNNFVLWPAVSRKLLTLFLQIRHFCANYSFPTFKNLSNYVCLKEFDKVI